MCIQTRCKEEDVASIYQATIDDCFKLALGKYSFFGFKEEAKGDETCDLIPFDDGCPVEYLDVNMALNWQIFEIVC